MKLSIIIPVFNEEKTIEKVLQRIIALTIPSVEKEIIVVDDASTDHTIQKIIKYFGKRKKGLVLLTHEKNQGKGAAVRTGINRATGDYVIIQDADLEYNPEDIIRLAKEISPKRKVIYGTRLKRLPHFAKEESTPRFLMHYLGNKFLSLMTSILYGQWITDMETCYKLFPKKAVKNMKLHARGFEFEPEITAKLLKQRYIIHEIPISTSPRGYQEGKKLNTIRDGSKALYTLFRYRFLD